MLITGHKGFIGSAIHERAPDAIGLDIKENPRNTITHASTVYGHMVPNSTAYHLAAISGVMDCIKSPSSCERTNVFGSVNVLQCARENNCKVVLASSGAVKTANHPYAASKRAMEDFATAYRETYGLNTVILRLSNVYGPGSIDKTSAIAQFCKDALTKGEITIYGDGEQTRDFVYIDDVVVAFLQDHDKPLYQVVGGYQYTINDIASYIGGYTRAGIIHKEARQGDVRTNATDRKLPTIRGKTSIQEGIKKTLEYFRGIYA